VAAASVVALLLMAVAHTRELEAERNAALDARREAEDLLDFMLEDLHSGLERVGRLDLLEQVARRSLDYYDRRPAGRSEEEIRGRAAALRNSARVLGAQGDMKAAIEAYERNRVVFEELARTDSRPVWQLELAQAHRTLAGAHSDEGDLDKALEHGRRAVELSARLTDPEDERWARAHFENLASLGWSRGEAGEVDGALATLAEAHDLAAGPAQAAVGGAAWRHRQAVALSYIGIVHYQQGELAEARDRFLAALELCRALVGSDPANVLFREELQLVLGRLGSTQLDLGDLSSAEQTLEAARREAEGLVALEPGNIGWLRELSVAHSNLAAVRREQGRLREALEGMERSLEISRTLTIRLAGSVSAANDLGWDLLEVGRLRRQLGYEARARKDWQEAVRVLRHARRDDATSSYYLDTEVQALLELGRTEEARPLVEQLLQAGWQTPDFLALAAEHGLVPEAEELSP
ncbi:MAG: tetratricopeptide repeat protein, partial [Holophagales bacterium]|nr:tetratricopeptide repeat protein [Holophagales bacterium]